MLKKCVIILSTFNQKEVNTVMEYIQKLINKNFNGHHIEAKDIGVVTPYKLQCEKIERQCKYLNLGHITTGSAEKFQGNEKPIMIVSMVRADERSLGKFVTDKQVHGFSHTVKLLITIIVILHHTAFLNQR